MAGERQGSVRVVVARLKAVKRPVPFAYTRTRSNRAWQVRGKVVGGWAPTPYNESWATCFSLAVTSSRDGSRRGRWVTRAGGEWPVMPNAVRLRPTLSGMSERPYPGDHSARSALYVRSCLRLRGHCANRVQLTPAARPRRAVRPSAPLPSAPIELGCMAGAFSTHRVDAQSNTERRILSKVPSNPRPRLPAWTVSRPRTWGWTAWTGARCR